MIKVVVSACLLGAPVRYNAEHKKSESPVLLRWRDEGRIVSVCPEMLGGLGTPRPPAEIRFANGVRRVFTNQGRDVTAEFVVGARESLAAAEENRVRIAILKEGSPSCGSTYVYDGTFSRTKLPGAGVTASLLREHGIAVFSEEELEAADAYLRELESRSV